MKEEIEQRFAQLLESGKQLLHRLPWGRDGSLNYWVRDDDIPSNQEWLSSCANLVRLVAYHDSHYSEECQRLITHENMASGIPATVIQKMFGLLSSAYEEWKHGVSAPVRTGPKKSCGIIATKEVQECPKASGHTRSGLSWC